MPHLSDGGISQFFRKMRILTLMFSNIIHQYKCSLMPRCVQKCKNKQNKVAHFLTVYEDGGMFIVQIYLFQSKKTTLSMKQKTLGVFYCFYQLDEVYFVK